MAVRTTGLMLAVAASLASHAAAQPVFSVGRDGPSALPSDVLFHSFGGFPVPVGGGPGMGMGRPGDDLNGVSVNAANLRAAKKFIICFSVDALSVGASRLRIPSFNVFDQANKNQAAGDVFLSTEAFQQGVGMLPPPTSMGLFNNVLRTNQSPVYPTVFGLLPAASPTDHLPPGDLDDVNAAMTGVPLPGTATYFTLAQGSPSLMFLPGTGSAADVFVDFDVNVPGTENLYAQFIQLGLQFGDDIDGLIVFDEDHDARFSTGDEVYFTLSPGSPTLLLFGFSAADVLVCNVPGAVALFAQHGDLGLLHTDNMDSLNAMALEGDSAEETIRSLVPPLCPADFNGDTVVNTLDVLAFLNAFVAQHPSADFNGDTIINTLDVLAFLNAYTAGCG
ncbi:MAG: hypothetical protein KIS87_03660 [Phycisphaeraceae bacterium]|nr:hypothetical protein [Phycisphaeraceae bacterium]